MKTSKPTPVGSVCVSEEKTPPTKVPRLWSARSLSERWHISRALVYRLHQQGKLRGVRLLGVLRFREDDILELLKHEGLG